MPLDEGVFTKILESLLSADNEARKSAEAEFEAAKTADSQWVMNALVHVVSHPAPPEIHAISLPLLRKMFNRENSTFDNLPSASQQSIRDGVVAAFVSLCENKSTQSSVSALLAALAAKVYFLNQTWDDLWQKLVASMADANAPANVRAGSCMVLESCATVLQPYLCNHHPALAEALALCMQSTDAGVRTAAAAAIATLIDTVEAKAIAQYRPLLDCILRGVEMSLNEGDEDSAVSQLSSMTSLIQCSPTILTSASGNVLQACMQVAATAEVPAEVRHVAVELLVTVCENTKVWKKIPSFPVSLIDLLFNYTLSPEISEDWDTTEENDSTEAEGNSDFDIGVTSIDRVCCAVGPKPLAEHIQELVKENLKSDSWNRRQAALSLITYSIEGLKSAFKIFLDRVLEMACACVADENKVVRYTAYQCLCQMSTDFCPDLQLQHHEKLMPALLHGLSDPIPKVAGMAVAGINSSYDEAEDGDEDEMHAANILSKYVEGFCKGLITLFNSTEHLFLRSTILAALASIIATEKTNMIPFVELLLPLLQSVLSVTENPANPQPVRMYKCRAIECLTLLAGSVKYQHFSQYAEPVCQYLVSMMAENLPNDDPRLSYVLRGWTNMIDCMGELVLPYMPAIMPALFNLANMDCDLEITPANVGDIDELEGEEGVEHMLLNIKGQGEVIVKTKTAQIEEKTTAANILSEFVRILGPQYAPWVSETAQCAKNLVAFCANSDVRLIGCEIYEHLIGVVAKVGRDQLPQFCAEIFHVIMDAVHKERDYSLVGNYLDVLAVIARECGAQIPDEVLSKFTKLISEVCGESANRRQQNMKELEQQHAAGEIDDDELEEMEEAIEEEEDILKNCQSAVEEYLKQVPQFTPYFEKDLYNLAGEMVGSQNDCISGVGLSFVASYIENSTNGSALAHLPELIPPMLTYAQSSMPDAVHNAFNCIRVTIETLARINNNSADAIKFVTEASGVIIPFLRSGKAKTDNFKGGVNNACSAALSIIKHFKDGIDASELLTNVTKHLPLGDADEEEAKRVHEELLLMIQQKNQLVSGQVGMTMITKIKDAAPDCLNENSVQLLQQC